MAENEKPSTPPATTPPAPPKKATGEYDRAHMPLGEEFDKAKWTMPPWQPVVIALAIIGIAVGVYSYVYRAKPPAEGAIDEITAVAIPGSDQVMAAVNVHFGNSSGYLIKVRTVKATLQTATGEFSDEAANASDFERYYQAFPDLKQNAKTPLMQDARIAPGANGIGTVIFSFPVTKEVFESRQSLTVSVVPYDGLPIVLKK